ncbi:MAG: hypothetical protein EKK63_02650 [Acinetobacter sp.]|uniref:hypothetical protein n=1 Tax=Acinetobacter sp. TaxID=472 RepID=UPI000F94FF4A|nr:hypothetical protein [Acinetobacter sp.]RUP42217.1 MAG: hypothetical protein EKK63_02650 [Acinetobacter sp.]
MASCTTCGGTISNPFDLSQVSTNSCQCNLAGLAVEGDASSECCVESVNGKTGKVVLTINDIDLGDNLFFADELVYNVLSAVSPIVFNNTTGEFSHATSGVTAGTYGNSSNYPVITVNATGHVTSITLQSVGAFSLGPDLTAIEALSSTGIAVRSATNTWVLRSLSGTAGRITVTNPSGIAGNPTFDLVTTGVTAGIYGGPASYPIITVDAYGRLTSASSSAFPPATIPAHTHSLGDLSNADASCDTQTAAEDGKCLIWENPNWVPSNNKYVYEFEEFTPTTNIYICTGNADIDVDDMDGPINKLQRWKDHYNKAVVHLDVALYIAASVVSGDLGTLGSSRYLVEKLIGTVPSGFEPIHTVNIPCQTTFAANRYWNTGHTIQFGSYCCIYSMGVTILPNGNVYLNLSYHSTDFRFPTLSATDQILCHILGSYPTKTITPS